ncbi:MAG: glycosyltransferase family 4 protein [Bacteroidetes bacterium]|nr:glycosyltransferase family 4 protein [Bacteroidota bacterium]MCL5737054.1 glycosyltransferase family 4 protein [Bacteroidota bacterium]
MQALLISRELQRRGHDVSLLCMPRTTLLKEAYAADIPTVGLLRDDRQALGIIKDLSRLLKSYNFDVVHTHLSHDLWWLVPAMKLSSSNAKLFLTKHMASGVKKTDPMHRFLYGRLNGTFAISNYIKGSVINTCPVPETSVHVLSPGISLEDFDPSLYRKSEVRAELSIPADAVLVGMVGRMSPGKGHEEFLKAAKNLIESSDLNLRFLITGSASYGEEAYATKIRELAEELDVNKVTRFTGFRKDVPRLLSALDVLAFPSHEESFGLTLLEAMAMKLPVVASGNAGVLDIVVDGETGILVPPENYQSLAEGISRLARDPRMRREYGDAGRKRVEEFFSIESVVKKLESYYAEEPLKD